MAFVPLALSFLLRAGALASLADTPTVAFALVAAHAARPRESPAFMRLVPPARPRRLVLRRRPAAEGERAPPRRIACSTLALTLGIGFPRALSSQSSLFCSVSSSFSVASGERQISG